MSMCMWQEVKALQLYQLLGAEIHLQVQFRIEVRYIARSDLCCTCHTFHFEQNLRWRCQQQWEELFSMCSHPVMVRLCSFFSQINNRLNVGMMQQCRESVFCFFIMSQKISNLTRQLNSNYRVAHSIAPITWSTAGIEWWWRLRGKQLPGALSCVNTVRKDAVRPKKQICFGLCYRKHKCLRLYIRTVENFKSKLRLK